MKHTQCQIPPQLLGSPHQSIYHSASATSLPYPLPPQPLPRLVYLWLWDGEKHFNVYTHEHTCTSTNHPPTHIGSHILRTTQTHTYAYTVYAEHAVRPFCKKSNNCYVLCNTPETDNPLSSTSSAPTIPGCDILKDTCMQQCKFNSSTMYSTRSGSHFLHLSLDFRLHFHST